MSERKEILAGLWHSLSDLIGEFQNPGAAAQPSRCILQLACFTGSPRSALAASLKCDWVEPWHDHCPLHITYDLGNWSCALI
jgi:hypothetical protein